MYNSIRFLQSADLQLVHSAQARPRSLSWMGLGLSTLCVCSLSVGIGFQPAVAESVRLKPSAPTQPKAAPRALMDKLAEVDLVANQKDLPKLMRFYSNNFVNGDGLNREALKQVIAAFWQDYPSLTYKTQLVAWKQDAQGGYITETKTTITGTQSIDQGSVQLESTLHARQHWVGAQITKQEILAEHSQLKSGSKPPQIKVNLPQEVAVGEKFDFDVIVADPLGDHPLLGLAVEEPVNLQNYMKQPPLKLELLPAGGLFKVGTAADKPTSEWISAILVQDGGMTIISHRLNVVPKKSPAQQSQQ